MGFENFGLVSFTSETKAADFLQFLGKGEIMTTKCRGCGKMYFPPRMDCSVCGTSEVDWIAIDKPGKLVAYSMVMYGPTGFENDVPYTVAVIRFQNGLQVFGRINKDVPIDNIKVGMVLKPVPIKLPPDKVSYEFIQA
jgi:uncharacterized protein